MALTLNIATIVTNPIYAGVFAALVIAFMNYIYKWKTSDKVTGKNIAYNALIGFVVVAITVLYTKKSLSFADEFIDTRPPPF